MIYCGLIYLNISSISILSYMFVYLVITCLHPNIGQCESYAHTKLANFPILILNQDELYEWDFDCNGICVVCKWDRDGMHIPEL